jgi:hypothetical protein
MVDHTTTESTVGDESSLRSIYERPMSLQSSSSSTGWMPIAGTSWLSRPSS